MPSRWITSATRNLTDAQRHVLESFFALLTDDELRDLQQRLGNVTSEAPWWLSDEIAKASRSRGHR